MTTDEIDFVVHQEAIRHNAYPSPLLYGGFPKSVCTSVNNVVCHGIPDRYILHWHSFHLCVYLIFIYIKCLANVISL